MSYQEYREFVELLFSKGKTTGPNQSPAYLDYTKMGIQRMKKWDKISQVSPLMKEKVTQLPPQTWLVLTEAWCGDAAQSIPYLQKLTEENPSIQLRLILRDENLEIMDAFLTNGARSIPKLIALGPDLEEVYFTWGPKPHYLIEKQRAFRQDPQGKTSADFSREAHLWYAKDRHQAIEQEFHTCFQQAFGL